MHSFSDTQINIFKDRYALRDAENPLITLEETPKEMWARIAQWVSSAEEPDERSEWESKFNEILEDFRFIPGGRIMHSAGSSAEVTSFNCFVIPSPHDSRKGIMASLDEWIETQARGGGVGMNVSSLRPKGEIVRGVHGTSSGPIPWAALFSYSSKEVTTQGGSRRGASLICIDDDHPDIFEFINVKRSAGMLEGSNLSIAISDEFMKAVEEDAEWQLKWGGKVYRTLPARELWEEITKAAWASGEPGCIWMGRYNKQRNLYYLESTKVTSTNPCLLGSTRMLTKDGLIPISEISAHDIYTPEGWSQGTAWKTGVKEVCEITLSNGLRLTATPDHKILIDDKKIPVEEALNKLIDPALGSGDWIGDDNWTEDDMTRMGWLMMRGERRYSDGTVCIPKLNKHKEYSLWPYFTAFTDTCVRKGKAFKSLPRSDLFYDVMDDFGFEWRNGPEFALPERFFRLSPRLAVAFLKGFFWSLGDVSHEIPQVRIHSKNLDILLGVQQMLAALGIRSNVIKLWGRTKYSLTIGINSSLAKFEELMRFRNKSKRDQLRLWVRRGTHADISKNKKYWPKVVKITKLEATDVYDFNVHADSHLGWANGLWVSNCGEIGMEPYGCCNLGVINVHRFVNDQGLINYDDIAYTAEHAVRFLDNVTDLSNYPLPQYRKQQMDIRREGIGITGLADALIKMKVPYGSKESYFIVEDIYRTICESTYRSSSNLARYRGMFPLCDPEKIVDSWLIQKLPDDIRASIRKHGLRNGYLTAQQPSGTQSLVAGVNSGFEPVFDFNAIRKDRTGTYKPTSEATKMADDYLKSHDKLAEYFVSANDLSPEQHVDVQAAAQKWIDQSVSKTVNSPSSHTVAQVDTLYRYGYSKGLKTIAYYRDGSRHEQVLYHDDKDSKSSKEAVSSASSVIRVKLPAERPSITHRFQIGEHEGYVTVGLYDDGRPGEIFITMSKEGSTIRGLMDAFATSISIALQHGVSIEQIYNKFSGSSFEPMGMTSNSEIPLASSVIDYIARWLASRFMHEGDIKISEQQGSICPDCGKIATWGEGCVLCQHCGWSRCG